MVSREFLSKIPIFERLSQDDHDVLLKLWQRRELSKEQVLFRKGETGNSMFVIESGTVEITVPVVEQVKEMRVSVLQEGDFFGELSLVDGLPRTATATALEDCRLLEMKREDFVSFLMVRPAVAISMISEIGKRLRSTNELVTSLASKNLNVEVDEQLSFGDRLADKVAEFGGSWAFIASFFVFLAIWIIVNAIQFLFGAFDPYPYVFLNLVLAVVSSIQGPFIMMSQNRAQRVDRLKADLDYQVNMKSELLLQQLHAKVDELRATELHGLHVGLSKALANLDQRLEALEQGPDGKIHRLTREKP